MSVSQDIIDAKVFLGNAKNSSNPKTRDAWLGVHNGMVIFDPAIVEEQIKAARSMFVDAKKANKDVLVICEKEMYKEDVEKLAEKYGFHYMNHKIPAGVLTNFDTLLSRIKSLQELRGYIGSDMYDSLTKKEQSMRKRALTKIEKVYKGVSNLRKKPDLVIIVDGQMMHKFVDEVENLSIASIILASSNFDSWTKSHMVLCNVNSQKSIDFVLKNIVA